MAAGHLRHGRAHRKQAGALRVRITPLPQKQLWQVRVSAAAIDGCRLGELGIWKLMEMPASAVIIEAASQPDGGISYIIRTRQPLVGPGQIYAPPYGVTVERIE